VAGPKRTMGKFGAAIPLPRRQSRAMVNRRLAK
jgi:hypothetical protein